VACTLMDGAGPWDTLVIEPSDSVPLLLAVHVEAHGNRTLMISNGDGWEQRGRDVRTFGRQE
jgi:hypothetical protein